MFECTLCLSCMNECGYPCMKMYECMNVYMNECHVFVHVMYVPCMMYMYAFMYITNLVLVCAHVCTYAYSWIQFPTYAYLQ